MTVWLADTKVPEAHTGFAVILPTDTEQMLVFLFVLILLILLTDGFNSNSKDHHTLLLFPHDDGQWFVRSNQELGGNQKHSGKLN